MKIEMVNTYKSCIDEANKVIDLMNSLKCYCEQSIKESEYEDCCGNGGDGINDPDNIPLRRFVRVNPSDIIRNHVLMDAEVKARRNRLITVDMSKVLQIINLGNKSEDDCCDNCDYDCRDRVRTEAPMGVDRSVVVFVRKL